MDVFENRFLTYEKKKVYLASHIARVRKSQNTFKKTLA